MYDLFDDFPATDAAYFEAANNAHDLAHWKPTHDAVYEAGRRVGFSKLRRRDIGAGKRAFANAYKDVCKAWLRGERFKRDEIKPQQHGEKISESDLLHRRVFGRAMVGQLREILRS
ncbi:hypothetical protein [Marinomonas sp. ef1]|uniref:hypothetical protein n=1 Tax=Marinomonas sp. ef1 TaxID=2005043 RepID=UPI000C291FBD|nr:hypothetical protein [Marinomonas sp. ef1]